MVAPDVPVDIVIVAYGGLGESSPIVTNSTWSARTDEGGNDVRIIVATSATSELTPRPRNTRGLAKASSIELVFILLEYFRQVTLVKKKVDCSSEQERTTGR